MFKKFSREDGVAGLNQIKSSVARGIRSSIVESYPYLEDTGLIDHLIPKKEPMIIAKTQNKEQLCVVGGTPLFFADRDGPWYPTLRLLHMYPDMMTIIRTDAGAIKFVLSGANIMCPGLTHPNAHMPDDLEAGVPVAIYGEGKQHAMAVGITKMSAADMRSINKGIGVDNLHHLNDGLWKTNHIS